MKHFTLILFLLVGTWMFSQEQNKDSIPISETERIVDKYGDKIINGFNNIIKDVTPIAVDGFEVVVNLQIARAIGYLIIALFLFIPSGFTAWFFKWSYTIPEGNRHPRNYDDDWSFLLVISTVISLITLGFAVNLIYHSVLLFIAPEWFAIKEILDLL